MNCAGFSRELLETELFGHEKGAFTGATASKMDSLKLLIGTVFLDEIATWILRFNPSCSSA